MAAAKPKPSRKVGRPRTVQWREVTRLAEKGVELTDILAALDVPKGYAQREAQRFEAVVSKGNAVFRTQLASRVARESIGKGRSHALLAAARQHLGYDKPKADPEMSWQTVHRTAAEALETINRMLSAHRTQHPHARSVQTCDVHKRVYACPECSAPGVIVPACCVEHDVERRLAAGPEVEELRPAGPELPAEGEGA